MSQNTHQGHNTLRLLQKSGFHNSCLPHKHTHTHTLAFLYTEHTANFPLPATLKPVKKFSLCAKWMIHTHTHTKSLLFSCKEKKPTSSVTRLSLYSHQHVSCTVMNVHAQTHTQKPSHNNTPFLCTAVLVSGNTGGRRYLSPCACGQSAEAVM